jgi:hypothetical protein
LSNAYAAAETDLWVAEVAADNVWNTATATNSAAEANIKMMEGGRVPTAFVWSRTASNRSLRVLQVNLFEPRGQIRSAMSAKIKTLPIIEHRDCHLCGICCRGSQVFLDDKSSGRYTSATKRPSGCSSFANVAK